MDGESLDFSFSGLKSAVKRYIDTKDILNSEDREEIAFAFEEAVFDVLLRKIFFATKKYHAHTVCLAGGVSANTVLRDRMFQESRVLGIPFFAPTQIRYSQDNAAMVGIRAYYEILSRNTTT